MRLLTICSMLAVTLLGTAVDAAVGAAVTSSLPTQQPMMTTCPILPSCPLPYAPQVLAQLCLTPAQCCAANQIVQQTNNAMQVLVAYTYVSRDEDITHFFEPLDQVLSEQNAALQCELGRRHPNPVALAQYSGTIAQLSTQRQVVVAAANAELVALLTPAQRQQYMQLACACGVGY